MHAAKQGLNPTLCVQEGRTRVGHPAPGYGAKTAARESHVFDSRRAATGIVFGVPAAVRLGRADAAILAVAF
jgi:hypothetical protein